MMTEQQERDLAGIKNLGFDNVQGDLSHISRGSAAGISEDRIYLDDETVRTSNTQIIEVTEDAEGVTRRLSRNVGR